MLDPRLALRLPLTSTLALRQAIGRYHQPPTPGDVDPNGGNPNLKSSYYDSTSLGLEAIASDWSASVTGLARCVSSASS